MTLHFTHKKRRYDDGCAVAQIMDVIGERWALMVMREMIFGPRRFTDLRAALPGISANVLSQRLTALQAAGIARKLAGPHGVQLYELTEWGAESEILFRIIGRWAARSPQLCAAPMSVASIILSMRTMFSAERAGDFAATIGFRFGADEFRGVVKNGVLDLDVGTAAGADAIFTGTPDGLAAALYGGVALPELAQAGVLAVEGKVDDARRYLALFPLPDPAPAGDGIAPSTSD